MAIGTNHYSGTTLAGVIPEIWTSKLNDFYRAALVTANFFTDLSSEIDGGGDIFHIPTFAEMTANAKVIGSTITLNETTVTTIDLTVTTWYETSFIIEDRPGRTMKQSYSTQERMAKNAGYTTAAVYEDAIIALFASFTQTTGVSTSKLLDSAVRASIEYLDLANSPLDDRAFFLHPTQFWSMQADDKFALAINTAGADPIMKRPNAHLYGIPVYMSTRLPAISGVSGVGKVNCLAHKDAIAHASTPVRLQANYIPEYLGILVTADVQYGAVENRDTSGVYIKTSA